MATLVLGTVGRTLGGPLGGLAGTVLGSAVDRGIVGGGLTREGPRTANLAVQSAAYGEALPRLYGRMRVAGTLVWTAGIREARSVSGGGKRGAAAAAYSYSASFAVILAARAIVRVERIWADGKLLRDGGGGMIFPARFRVYPGSEDQPVDPLIAAAEGVGAAPAYRGRAYVVFEDLALADFGNRIPNLTFEVVADDGPVGMGMIAGDIAGIAGGGAGLPSLAGFAAARAGSVRATLDQLAAFADLGFDDAPGGMTVRDAAGPVTVVPADALGASAAGGDPARREARAAAVPDAIVLGFSDTGRDFQPGLQRAVRRSPAVRIEQRDLTASLDAASAKALAEAILRRAIAARSTAMFVVSWRFAGLRPGMRVRAEPDPEVWRIRRTTLTGATVEIEAERVATLPGSVAPAADAGRGYDARDAPQGATVLHVLDLPPLPGALPTTPRLLLAAGGTGNWRRAAVVMSRDDGARYAPVATVDAAATIGTATTALATGCTDRWDRRSMVEVTLLDDAAGLESATEAAVLAGANLALVGGEIVQFAVATAIGPARYRLSTLLRGRRGTEVAAVGHAVGERFVMLDAERLTAIDVDAVGLPLTFKAVGPGDDAVAVPAVVVVPAGAALRPLSPAGVTARRTVDGWNIGWIRRSRNGFAWTDGVDAPLAEESERYRVAVALDGQTVREVDTAVSGLTYAAADFAADGGATARRLDIAVAQVSAIVGPGDRATLTITL